MTTRATVSVRSCADPQKAEKQIPLPYVLTNTPLRVDLVRDTHKNVAKNHRQPYGVSTKAGHQTSAESWGTGRAVARIPRVGGSGTHRAGQGAFGNMCRGGHMFAPTKVWRRWHRKTNLTLRRHAIASALAATSETALVMARGHQIGQVPEVPLVLSDDFEAVKKTKDAKAILEAAGLGAELQKVKDTKRNRPGKGKLRNRRKLQKLGPLIIHTKSEGLENAVSNLPGVETLPVSRLNLLMLAPGGSMGRLVVWTESAISELQVMYGDGAAQKPGKVNYTLPRSVMTNADVERIINSDEVQAALRLKHKQLPTPLAPNFLKNKAARLTIDPAMPAREKRALQAAADGKKRRAVA